MIVRRIENDRRVGHLRDRAHLADELVAIHGRHEDIADDQVGPSASHEVERLAAVGRLEHRVPVMSQQRDKEVPIDRASFGNQDAGHVSSVRADEDHAGWRRGAIRRRSNERRHRIGVSARIVPDRSDLTRLRAARRVSTP